MQSSIRKRRRNEVIKRIRSYSFTSFKRICSGIILAGLVVGCAHSKKQTQTKVFSSLCLSGEGKGRIEHLGGRYVFSFENALKNKEKEWLLALSMPMHGEEVLTLGFGEADKSKIQVSGKFYRRMIYAARKENKKLELKRLQKILMKIGVFLKAVDLVRIGDYPCSDGKCEIGGKHKFTYSETNDELLVNFPFDANHNFIINARANSSYYRKINFILQDKRRRSDARQPFKLSLIQRECTEAI